MTAGIIERRNINIYRNTAVCKRRWLIAAGKKHIDISGENLLIHRRTDTIKPIAERGFRWNTISNSERDLVKFLVFVELIDVLKVRFSERQQTDHSQNDIAVFDLRL